MKNSHPDHSNVKLQWGEINEGHLNILARVKNNATKQRIGK